jgi:hypothetical protein
VTRPNLRDTFSRQQAAVQQQIDAITRFSQLGNSTIKDGAVIVLDANGAARVSMGEYIWPTYPHIGAVVNGLVVFDGSGNPVLVDGLLPDGTYALAVYDSAGRERTRIGTLTSGGYGLQVNDPVTAAANEVLPMTMDYQTAGPAATTSTTPVTFGSAGGTAPSVTAYIGASQDAQIMVSCNCATTNSTEDLRLYLTIDGVLQSSTTAILLGNEGTHTAMFSLKKWLASVGQPNVTANADHTFSLELSSAAGTTVRCGLPSLSVKPI